MLRNKNILLGITGGIAAYKAADLTSKLKKEGANVKVVMTENSTNFISPLTFQTLSENVVYIDMFHPLNNMDVEHISLAKWADVIVIAPATANTIAKINNGIADNMLTTIVLAKRTSVIIAPAMNTKMLENEVTKKNLTELKNKGFCILPTEQGRLACGDLGSGKMISTERILDKINFIISKKDLNGIKFVITASGTREAIDPVRFITNKSSGKMGYQIAKEARNRGANVVLISGPSPLNPPEDVEFVSVESTKDMFDAVGKYFYKSDVFISPSAPADYGLKKYSNQKIKKDLAKDMLSLELSANPDIIMHYGKQKENRVVVGFAAESENLIEHAKKKLTKKNLDFIVANNVIQEGAGFTTDTNIVTIIDNNGFEEYGLMSKRDLANIVLDKVKLRLS